MLRALCITLFFTLSALYTFAQPSLAVRYDRSAVGTPTDIFWTSPTDYWVATTAGVGQYSTTGQSAQHHLLSGPNGAADASVISGHNGMIWVGSADQGLYKYDGSSWQFFSGAEGMPNSPVTDINFDAAGNIYVLTETDILRYDSTLAKFQFFGMGGTALAIHHNTLYVSDFQSLQNPGSYYDGSTWHLLPAASNLGRNKALAIEVTTDSVIYITSNLGVSKLDNGNWTDLTTPNSGNKQLVALGQHVYSCTGAGRLLRFGMSATDTSSSVSYNRTSDPTLLDINSRGALSVLEPNGSIWLYHYNWDRAESVYKALTIGRIKAGFSPSGELFTDRSIENKDEFGFVGLRADERVAIFTSNIWLKGVNQNADTMIMAQQYRQTGADQFSGPRSAVYDSAYVYKYNHVWKVTSSEIDYHKQHYTDPNYTMPFGIAHWPGNGDTQKGQSQFLAPFEDVNYNGKYEPRYGEYPRIRGDEAVYFIYNDSRGQKTETGAEPMDLEIHCMAYAYDSSSYAPLHNAIFMSYKLINHSNTDYTDFTFGIWSDFDLGNHVDDAIGSDSATQIAYVYNADTDDEGPFGYGSYPPALGISFLNTDMHGLMYYNNTSNSVSGNPVLPSHINMILQSRWKNGWPLVVENPSGPGSTQNGDGFDPSGMGTPTRWAYNDAENRYQSPASLQDKRAVTYTNLGTFQAGTERCIDWAYVYARDSNSTNLLASVQHMKALIPGMRQHYQAEDPECLGAFMDLEERIHDNALTRQYPNPAKAGQFIYVETELNVNKVDLYAITGQHMQTVVPERISDQALRFPVRSDLAHGMYILSVQFEDREPYTQKVLITR